MERKRLYVISSLHLGYDREDNIRTKVEQTLETRLRLIESLSTSLGQGSYFSDGLYKGLSDLLNHAIGDSLDNLIRKQNQELYDAGGKRFHEYEIGKVAEIFARLRRKGITFEFKHTETKKGISSRGIDLRDFEMVKNIISNGSAENLLYVGSGHPLKYLEESGLEWYRIRIAALDDAVVATGSLPKRLERLQGLPRTTQSKMPIYWDIKYI